MPAPTAHPQRSRRDRCPGVFRPWPADDGGLVRLRLIGGQLSGESLAALGEVARTYGDGDVHLTKRANLQLRAMPATDGDLPGEVVEAIAATGLLPSRTHELVRNVMVSPETGLAGGRTDVRPVAGGARPAALRRPRTGKAARTVPLRARRRTRRPGRAQLRPRADRPGRRPRPAPRRREWGPVLSLDLAASALVDLARRFLGVRGEAADAPWHVDELSSAGPGGHPGPARDGAPPLPCRSAWSTAAPTWPSPTGCSTPPGSRGWPALELVVTPWHGVLVPGGEEDQ